MEHSFGTGEPFSLGVEEELCLVAPATGALLNDSVAVLDRLDAPDAGEVEREVLACQVELISGVCETVADAMGQLGELEARRRRATVSPPLTWPARWGARGSR